MVTYARPPPHNMEMRWPSEAGWEFDYDSEVTVVFDDETWLPLTPVYQAMLGGVAFGLELLYPNVPWVTPSNTKVATMKRCIPGWAHLKVCAKMEENP